MSRKIGWAITACAVVACVGSDPAATTTEDAGAPPTPSGPTDSGVPVLSPDAAPPANCPLGCLPPAPAGWTGPSATYDGAEAGKPSGCPSPYTLAEVDGHQGAAGADATCDCGTAAFQNASCTATVETWANGLCTMGALADGTVTSPGPCHDIADGTNGFMKLTTPTLARGTCTYPSPSKTLPPITREKIDVACGLVQGASCEARPDCVASPTPPAPFTRLCIHKDGDESCPSADYAQRFVVFKNVDDKRTCTACTGTTAGGSCSNTWDFSSAALCTAGTPPSAKTTGTCYSNPGIGAHVNARAMAPTGITCTPSGGMPDGKVASTDPVTFCCNR